MKPKIADQVATEDWDLLEKVRQIINLLPETLPCRAYLFGKRFEKDFAMSSIIPNCHAVARALAYFLPVTVHDGMVWEYIPEEEKARRHRHSWLTRKGGNDSIIIDPWPLGSVGGPTIFIQGYGFHFKEGLFKRSPTCIPEFRSEVAATRLAIRKLLNPATT